MWPLVFAVALAGARDAAAPSSAPPSIGCRRPTRRLGTGT